VKVWCLALVTMLVATPALSEPWGLSATPTECAALESLVVFGLVDGGPDGDTTAFTAVVRSGDPLQCQVWLDGYGLGEGMRIESCREAFDLLNANGLPEWQVGSEPGFIEDLLTPQYADACADMIFDLTAGQ
jgi:hypothetical protein